MYNDLLGGGDENISFCRNFTKKGGFAVSISKFLLISNKMCLCRKQYVLNGSCVHNFDYTSVMINNTYTADVKDD